MTAHVTPGQPLNPANAAPTVPIVVLGTDAVLAALPATPVQLAHACMRAGFANVIPASWGDELIASGMLRRLPDFGTGPAIQCSCPIVAHRLLTVGGDLRPALVALVPPPVAIARYIKAVSSPTRTRITYVGACPGAIDESIDIRMTPSALIAMLAERQIMLDEQPRVFESIIPPDRRRYVSQPGGLPTAEALWNEFGSRSLVELEGDDLVNDLSQQLLAGKNVLIDVATRLGCVCSGAVGDVAPEQARAQVTAHEPPRASTPVVDELDAVDLDLPLPAVPRTPVDVLAVPHSPPVNRPAAVAPASAATVLGARVASGRGLSTLLEPRPSRPSTPPSARPVHGSLPVARGGEGRSLPRAYVARRRSSPKGLPAINATSAVLTPPTDAPAISESAITPPAFPQRGVQNAAEDVAQTPTPEPPPAKRTPASAPVRSPAQSPATPPPGSTRPASHTPVAGAAASASQAARATTPAPVKQPIAPDRASVPRAQPAAAGTPSFATPVIPPARTHAPPAPKAAAVPRTTPPRTSQAAHGAAAAPPQVVPPAKPAAPQPVPILITRSGPPFSSRQAIVGLIVVLVIALSVGAIVAVVVARSMREPPVPSGVAR